MLLILSLFVLKLLFSVRQCFKRNFATDGQGELTALYKFHVENGGKMVNFGGYMLPVNYSDLSIKNSHLFTRKNASVFDVSHMLQTEIFGNDSVEYIETVCTADVRNLNIGGSTLTVFTNKNGGILDDLIITKCCGDQLYLVSNAARKQHDMQHLKNALVEFKKQKSKADVQLNFLQPSEQTLLALQGPKSAEVLQKLTDLDLSRLYFMTSSLGNVDDVESCRITRCGYTGEDGFEISLPSSKAINIAKRLLENESVKLAGLGARDTLRLEAGLCLYGNDISEETTPVEAALTWLVAKRRREEKNFPGAENIIEQIKEGSSVKRIGLISETGPPARQGSLIVSHEGEQIGIVTSGCPSPSIGMNIAMGYVRKDFVKSGSEVNVKIREKLYKSVVTKMPFIKANYYTKPE